MVRQVQVVRSWMTVACAPFRPFQYLPGTSAALAFLCSSLSE